MEIQALRRCLPCPAVCPSPPPAVLRQALGLEAGTPLGPALLAGLSDPARDGLAALMQVLLCGEESAALTFNAHALRGADDAARRIWRGIAADETLHEALLGHLVQALTDHGLPQPPQTKRAAQLFFMRLKSADAEIHFARIAALDCLVTRVLAALQGRHSLLHGQAVLMRMLSRIRHDEGRHVRATRGFLLEAGAPAALLAAERLWVAECFRHFLAPYACAFDRVHVDPHILMKCLH
ncbi:MAG TPA: hypothetical protein VIT92_09445 [Burkholderiaceae bacterium]